jgi:hypothetical protein
VRLIHALVYRCVRWLGDWWRRRQEWKRIERDAQRWIDSGEI